MAIINCPSNIEINTFKNEVLKIFYKMNYKALS